jgi:hypothetical protein
VSCCVGTFSERKVDVEKCVDCQFYDRKNAKSTDGRATMWGQCRRQAPHLNPMNVKRYVVEGIWPLVRDDDWCGEWKVLSHDLADQAATQAAAQVAAQVAAQMPAEPAQQPAPTPAEPVAMAAARKRIAPVSSAAAAGDD